MKNQYNLFKRVIKLSKSDKWDDAIKEWEVIEITEAQNEDFGSCICGKYPIKEMIQLFNPKTKKEIIVGNCCIKKFFKIKDYNKVFKAIKQNRINKFMIEECFKKKIINSWEQDFSLNVWRKRNFTQKQNLTFKRIKKKILGYYKSNSIKLREEQK